MCLNLQTKKRGDLTNNNLQDKHDQTNNQTYRLKKKANIYR